LDLELDQVAERELINGGRDAGLLDLLCQPVHAGRENRAERAPEDVDPRLRQVDRRSFRRRGDQGVVGNRAWYRDGPCPRSVMGDRSGKGEQSRGSNASESGHAPSAASRGTEVSPSPG